MEIYEDYPEVYDKLYADMKDYRWEAGQVLNAVPVDDGRLVNFGCGTGLHDQYFVNEFDVVGVDVNSAMLDVARRKNHRARYVQGEITSVSLRGEFDVAVSLFGVLSYLDDNEELEEAIWNMSECLGDEGVLVIDYLEPRRKPIEEGPLQPHTYQEEGVSVARTGEAKVPSEEELVMRYQTVVADKSGVHHFEDVHHLQPFSRDDYESAFSNAGLSPELVGDEWPLWVASK
jgi:SAM-dependent methyltransferase